MILFEFYFDSTGHIISVVIEKKITPFVHFRQRTNIEADNKKTNKF